MRSGQKYEIQRVHPDANPDKNAGPGPLVVATCCAFVVQGLDEGSLEPEGLNIMQHDAEMSAKALILEFPSTFWTYPDKF
jgi:hypothetical protein